MGKVLLLFLLLCVIAINNARILNVKITTDNHINEVDSRFLSFTVDPKYLFGNDEHFDRKESLCMASSLKPAFLRIAGPSTSKMVLQNSTITFTDLDEVINQKKEENLKILVDIGDKKDLNTKEYDTNANTDQEIKIKDKVSEKDDWKIPKREKRKTKEDKLAVTYYQWKKFVDWTKSTGFDLVFALNHEEKLENGLWDPQQVMEVLTLAEKANVGDMYWQLGYECKNQTLEDYFNDLETLRLIVETFPEGDKWRTLGSDVTHCLEGHSKSDFKDYVVLSDDNMHAIILNGNSSAAELNKLPEKDRLSLLKRLSDSTTPLWLTESPQIEILNSDLERAAEWLLSLGFAAQNGFTVHFRELVEKELHEPTLSFYMALLYKNLVGSRVLNVDMVASQTIVFAHCTSLRHKPVSGAVTLYAVNMDDEPARLAIRLANREKGGDVMQFILGTDSFGNIVVNGRAIHQNGDINPIVKKVRPYKTLLISLPPKSFGFWVLANTNVAACQHIDVGEELEDINSKEINDIRTKRYVGSKASDADKLKDDINVMDSLKKRFVNLNNDINNSHRIFKRKSEKGGRSSVKVKRQVEEEEGRKKPFTRLFSERSRVAEELKPRSELIKRLMSFGNRLNFTRPRADRRKLKFNKNFKSIRSSKLRRYKPEMSEHAVEEAATEFNRRKRSLVFDELKKDKTKDFDHSIENEIDIDRQEEKLYKILKKIHKQLKDEHLEDDNSNQSDSKAIEDEIVVKTKLSDDVSSINIKEKSKKGLLKSTISKVTDVLGDLNDNLNRFWDIINVVD